MKIALIGYGKMGKEIEEIAISRGHEIVFKASEAINSSTIGLEEADVAIEFSQPHAAANNILECFNRKIPVVVGTTGWYGRLNEVKDACHEHNGAILYSTNFSIGVNIVFHINEILGKLMNDLDEYDPSILEIHHIHKLDKPSGTAITMAEGILSAVTRKKEWINESSEEAEKLSIVSERTDEVPGTHVISYESAVDKIELTHIAKNRKGFALGAVKGAEWLFGKTGTYSMRDFLKF
ncbi:MAG: 4-hydroxy-tetrahydrodipicolinate reductase [Bacteroidota bacterium]|jgi:4-hydroxy-tetrahydrodipicolinate reductase